MLKLVLELTWMKMQFLLKILMVSPYFLCCILFISKLHLCNSAIVVFELCNMTFFISFKFQPSLLSYIFFCWKSTCQGTLSEDEDSILS